MEATSNTDDCDRVDGLDASNGLPEDYDGRDSRVQEVIGDLETYLQQPEREIDLIASESLLEQLREEALLSNTGLRDDAESEDFGNSGVVGGVDTHVAESSMQTHPPQLNPFLVDVKSSPKATESPRFNPFIVDGVKDSDVVSSNNSDLNLLPLLSTGVSKECATSSQTQTDSEDVEVFPRPSLLFPPKGPKYVPVLKKDMVDVACGSEDLVVPRRRPTPLVRSTADISSAPGGKLRRSQSEHARHGLVEDSFDSRVLPRHFQNPTQKTFEANPKDSRNTNQPLMNDDYSFPLISDSGDNSKEKSLPALPEFSSEPYDKIEPFQEKADFNETPGFDASYANPCSTYSTKLHSVGGTSGSVGHPKSNDFRQLKTITEEDVMQYDSCVRKVKFAEKRGPSFGEVLVGVPVTSQDWEHGDAALGRTSVYSVTRGGERIAGETAFLDESMMRPDVTDVESLQGEGGEVESRLRINHFLVPVLTLEVLILTCLAILAFYLRFTDEFPVFERAIFCDDKSLRYPYYGSGYATFEVRPTVLYSVCFLLPPILIIVGEVGYWLFSTKPRKVIRAHCNSCKITLTYRRLLRFIGAFLLGALCTSILTDAIKLMAGRPRPYFLSVCDPLSTLCSPNSPIAVLNGTSACAFGDVKLVRHARLSFPSFYAALSAYSAVYTMVYLHNILRMHGTYALRPLLVLLIGGLSLLAGFSRLMAYRNHWQDVVAGFILGAGIAAYFGILLMNLFQEHSPKRRPEMYLAPPEEGSKFFRWFWIPRINFNKNSQRGYGGMYSNGPNDKGPLGPNPAFQQDLHRRIENFGKKNQKQPKHPKQPPPQPPMASQSPEAQTPEEEETNDQPVITTMQSDEHQRNSD